MAAAVGLSISSILLATCGITYGIKHHKYNNSTVQFFGALTGLLGILTIPSITLSKIQKHHRKRCNLRVKNIRNAVRTIHRDHSIDVATSFDLSWPPPQEYQDKLDLQRFHAALLHVSPPFELGDPNSEEDDRWWIEIPDSLQNSIKNGKLKDCLGSTVLRAPYLILKNHLIPSLQECIDGEYRKTKNWINQIKYGSNTPKKPDIINEPGTLGHGLWSSEEHQAPLPEGLHQLCSPQNLLDVDNFFCIGIYKNATYRYALCTDYLSSRLIKRIGLTPSTSTSYRNATFIIAPIKSEEDYAKPLSVYLTFPPPKEYENALELENQQYHSTLNSFLYNHGGVYTNMIHLIDEDEKVYESHSSNWVIIKNTLVSFRGVFDWDAIKKRFPTFHEALKTAQEQIDDEMNQNEKDYNTILSGLSIGDHLLGPIGTTTVNNYFGLQPNVMRLRATEYNYAKMLVAIVHTGGKKQHALCCAYEYPNFSSFENGNHLDTRASLSAPLYKFWEAPHAIINLSQEFNPNVETQTFAEAIACTPLWPRPKRYKTNPTEYYMLSSLRLFLAHYDKDAQSVVYLPDSFSPSIEYDNKQNAYARLGNMRFKYLMFDWAKIHERYPTIKRAFSAVQQRINRRIFHTSGNISSMQHESSSMILPEDDYYTINQNKTALCHHFWLNQKPDDPELEDCSLVHTYPRAFMFNCSDKANLNPTHCNEAAFMWSIVGKEYSEQRQCPCVHCYYELQNILRKIYGDDPTNIISNYVHKEPSAFNFKVALE